MEYEDASGEVERHHLCWGTKSTVSEFGPERAPAMQHKSAHTRENLELMMSDGKLKASREGLQ